MTALEHLEEVQDYCKKQKICCYCKYHKEENGGHYCLWNSIFYSHPYAWNFDDLEEVLKER